jgi:hypothetical protein
MPHSTPELPADLRAFLYSCIDAVEQVDILVLLRNSGKPWTAAATAVQLGLSDTTARHHLETLSARGLLQIGVAADVSYAYAPKSAELRRYGDRLSELHATSRTAIMRFVASSPLRLKRFSDAFKLRDVE